MVSYSLFQGSIIPLTVSDSDSDSSVTNPFHSDTDEPYVPDSFDDDEDEDEASFFPSQVGTLLSLKE